MAVYDHAHRLARNLKDSDEYQTYQEARQKILEDKKAREMLLDFQREEFTLQAKQMSGQEINEEDIKKISNLREIIGLNKKVKQYLEAEYRLGVLVSDLQRIIFADLEMGIEEEEEQEDEGFAAENAQTDHSETAEAEEAAQAEENANQGD